MVRHSGTSWVNAGIDQEGVPVPVAVTGGHKAPVAGHAIAQGPGRGHVVVPASGARRAARATKWRPTRPD